MHLSERLRTHRTSLGYTQAEYGTMLGLSSDRVGALERGRWPWRVPKPVQRRLAQVLDCAVADLGLVPRQRKPYRPHTPLGDVPTTLGARLARRRRQLGLTQADVADRLPTCHRTIICRWERGRVRPGKHMLARLAEVLGCHVDDLLPEIVAPGAEEIAYDRACPG